MDTSDRAPQFLTPEKAAQVLDVSRRTVYRLLRSGDLRGRRVGAQWRIPARALELSDDATDDAPAAV